jgi:GAF domain-containing protein
MATAPSSTEDNQEQLKTRVKQLSILHGIARAVTSVLDLQSALNRIVDAAVYLSGAEEGFLMLVDEQSQELHLRAGKGLEDKAAKVMRLPVNDSMAGQVVQTGKPLRMGGKSGNRDIKVKTGYLVKAILKVPIKGHDGRVLGVLSVDHAIDSFKTFSDQHVSLLTSLADYASIAIENARRYEEVSRRAEALRQSLSEAGEATRIPSRDADQDALQKFNEGLRHQQTVVDQVRKRVETLADELRARSDTAAEIADRLHAWNEQAENLIPQLDWIVQTALPRKATGQLADIAGETEGISIIDILLENLSSGVLLCNANGVVVQASQSVPKIVERPAEQIVHHPLQDLFPDDAHWEYLVGSVRLALALGDKHIPPPPEARATFYLAEKMLHASLYPTNRYHNQGIAIVTIIQDLSLPMAGWRVRDETVNALSESLRTPLAAIYSYGDLLLNESVGLITTAQRQYLERIRVSVDQMEATLRRFITMLKDDLAAQGGQGANLRTAFQDAVDAAREELTLAGVELDLDLETTLPPVHVAPEFFTRVMTDLLLKAGAHTPSGGTLSLSAKVQTGETGPDYLVVGISGLAAKSQEAQPVKDDIDLRSIAKAVQYQGGRLWVDADYQGTWQISFLLPVAA